MASNKSKTGSSRRKGDEYQDLTALQLALELYIQRQEYRLYIEYEKAGSLDDVVIEHADRVDAYQVKYAVNPNEVYVLDDFTNPNSKVYFKKFSDSWLALKKLYPSKDLTLHLFTNRALDAALSELITAEGYFIEQFIKGKKRKRSREIHQELQTCTQLHDYEFQEFLACFHFQIRQLTLPDLVQHIQGNLLDHELGISDRPIYHDLKEIIEDFAINKRDALTPKLIDEILRKTQSRYLLPQKFEVDKTLYVERDELKAKLNTTLKNVDGDYIVVTGLPGSGKSTALTVYFDEQEQLSNHTIIRYYCFVDINDNFQKRRVEARSLRVNLLSILQDKFHDILPRHFDYSEDNFYQMLKILGEYFKGNNQRLIILIDGLDHAERMESEIQESLIKALPTNVPKGAVIVVGTQELHKWPLFLKKSRENPNTHIELSLFALDQTKTYLIDKKQLTQLSEEQIQEIHRKSEGLPLYLRYITERISDIDDVGTELGQITRIPEGNIKNYYEMLWQEFVSLGRGNIRHLCGVLACLRFPLHKNELFSFQKELSRPDFDDCFQFIKHLLKQRDNQVEIFHNSFREFILSKLDSDWIHTIYADITDYLKSQKGSNLWFSYVFEYAYRANDYDYVLNEVNREFVDYALNRYRPNQDIENAIYWAAESAKETSDILTLSSLGALKSRTKERIEYHLDRNLLSKTLLAMGKEEDVLRYSYSLHFNEWLIDFPTALNLLKELPNQNKWEIGEKLFSVFEESFYGAKFQDRSDLLNYSYCLGIYDKSLTNALKWLSQIELKPDILETLQPYAPDYAPHLEVYLDAIVRHKPDEWWKKIKNSKKYFSNELTRFLLIRSVARYKTRNILKKEIEEYFSLFHPTFNPELAFHAALAGLSPKIITDLLGKTSLPPLEIPDNLSRSNPTLHNYRMIFFSLGYRDKKDSIELIKNHLKTKKSWWTDYLLYLLQAGECVGNHWARKQTDWFNLAIDSIDILRHINQARGERIVELLDLCRNELIESLFWLTKAVEEYYPNRLEEWFGKLSSLQDSKIWTTHYGIMESIEDYTFELDIYEKLVSIPKCLKYIFELLQICEEKFKKSTVLKGGARSDHFLKLALIAARCSSKNKAEEWLQYGIKSTLIYGYRNDTTLFQLIDIMEMLNKYEPERALKRSADILEMIDWMPHLTDGKGTKYLPQEIFKQVAKVNENAAFRLLRIFSKNKARWQMQDCLETLIKQIQEGDPQIFWPLTSVFANHFSEDGRYAKQVIDSKYHIIEIIENSGDLKLLEEYRHRFDYFIRTNITPRQWVKLTSKYWQPRDLVLYEEDTPSSQEASMMSKQKVYKIEGKVITNQEIKDRLSASFQEYKETLQKLKKENQSYYEPTITNSALKHHISQAIEYSDLLPIKDYLIKESKWTNADLLRELGNRFIELGDMENGLQCFELAYSNTIDWSRWKRNENDFKIIAEHDKQRAKNLLVNECYRSLTEYSGYDIPGLVASAYYIFGDIENLRRVYQGYLHHCQELFEQLPKREEYKWLTKYSVEVDNYNQLAINFLVDELDTAEIDLGNRLMDTYRDLCFAKPEVPLPIFVKRLSDANELTKSRLLTILYMIAIEKPNLIIPYAENISTLLDSKHFQWKMMTIKMLQSLLQSGKGSENIKQKLDSAQRCYSSIIGSSKFRLPRENLSEKFLDFFTNNTMKTIQKQIESCCGVLSIDKDIIFAKIEQTLKQEGWNDDDENERIKNEWRDHIHPQGYPIIWIIPSFNLRVFNLFNQILDEIVEKTIITADQIESLWYILQPADQEYKLTNIEPKPKDIAPLAVSDKDVWLSEINSKQGKVVHEHIAQEWVTLFEQRILSQDKTYEIPYRSTLLTYSSLIKKGLSRSFEEFEKESFYILKLRKFDDYESITLSQARELLTNHRSLTSIQSNSFLPILTWKTNSPLFFGYREVVSLSNYLINQYGLTYKDFDLYEDDKCVIKYEVWQEGYVDESYSRELLSHGTRLLINRSLLQKILQEYDAELCQSFFEKRLYYKSKHEEKATEENRSTSFMIVHG